jgi:hypothetical protein
MTLIRSTVQAEDRCFHPYLLVKLLFWFAVVCATFMPRCPAQNLYSSLRSCETLSRLRISACCSPAAKFPISPEIWELVRCIPDNLGRSAKTEIIDVLRVHNVGYQDFLQRSAMTRMKLFLKIGASTLPSWCA